MSSTMKNPSVLEEFSFSDDEGSQDTNSGHSGNSGQSGHSTHNGNGSYDHPPAKKSRNTIAVQSCIGSPFSSKATWQNNEKKTGLINKGTMTEDVQRPKAEKTKIFVEKSTMTDLITSLEPLQRLKPSSQQTSETPKFDQDGDIEQIINNSK